MAAYLKDGAVTITEPYDPTQVITTYGTGFETEEGDPSSPVTADNITKPDVVMLKVDVGEQRKEEYYPDEIHAVPSEDTYLPPTNRTPPKQNVGNDGRKKKTPKK